MIQAIKRLALRVSMLGRRKDLGGLDAFRDSIFSSFDKDLQNVGDFYNAACDALFASADAITVTPKFNMFDQDNLLVTWQKDKRTVNAYITKDDDGVFEVQVFFEVEDSESVEDTTVVLHDRTSTSTLAIYDFTEVGDYLNGR